MSISRRTFTLLLAMTPGLGGRSVTRILARNDLLSRSPEEFLKLAEDVLRREYKLTPKAIASLSRSATDVVDRTEEMERRLGALGISIVTAADVHYPVAIEEMDPDPPGVLFMYGNTKLLDSATFSVLSSRNTLPADLELMEMVTEQGVLNSEVLVAGHDRPEYQRAAVVPLRWGSPRMLVLDRGMFNVLGPDLRSEPFRAARLWRYEFDPTTDLVVSPFRPDADFVGVNNQVRDRLVGSLSKRLAFVNVAPGGNMEKIARMALKAGRKVQVSDRMIGYRELVELGAEVIRT